MNWTDISELLFKFIIGACIIIIILLAAYLMSKIIVPLAIMIFIVGAIIVGDMIIDGKT